MSLATEDLAALLDKVASYVDAIEADKQRAVSTERGARIEKIAEQYVAATGEDMPAHTRDKLANLDTDVLDQIMKVANNQTGALESLGRPAEKVAGRNSPSTVKEASAQAEERFLSFLINS